MDGRGKADDALIGTEKRKTIKILHGGKNIAINPPGILIAQECAGITPSKSIDVPKEYSIGKKIQSRLLSTSTDPKSQNNRFTFSDINRTRITDDILIMGYNSDGLPFQIIATGTSSYSIQQEQIVSFIQDHILPSIDDWSGQLSKCTPATILPENVCRDWIKSLYNKLHQPDDATWSYSFTLSIAICYSSISGSGKNQKEHIRCAGFGIGNNGIALKQKNGIVQLAYPTLIDGKSHAFDPLCNSTVAVNDTIFFHPPFDVEVHTNDELVAHSAAISVKLYKANDFTFPSQDEDDLSMPPLPSTCIKNVVQQFSLKADLSEHPILFEGIKGENTLELKKDRDLFNVKESEINDNLTLGSIYVPDYPTRVAIQKEILLPQEQDRLRAEYPVGKRSSIIDTILSSSSTSASYENISHNPVALCAIIRGCTAAFYTAQNTNNAFRDNDSQQLVAPPTRLHYAIDQIEQSNNPSLKVFGGALMALGVLACTFGILGFFAPVFKNKSPFFNALNDIFGEPGSTAFLIGGASVFVTGLTLFLNPCKCNPTPERERAYSRIRMGDV